LSCRLSTVALAAALMLAACGGGNDDPTLPTQATAAGEARGGGHPSGSVGMAADPAEADRTIGIQAGDDLRFEPSVVEVAAGQTVTFVVTNTGQTPHEFILGDEALQEEHERDMQEGGMEHGADNTVELAAGETAELTWRFDEPGEVLFGCHEPGHYPAGMVGTVRVS
jgi:uncharacterized cupredoxin-like copper-binding protein